MKRITGRRSTDRLLPAWLRCSGLPLVSTRVSPVLTTTLVSLVILLKAGIFCSETVGCFLPWISKPIRRTDSGVSSRSMCRLSGEMVGVNVRMSPNLYVIQMVEKQEEAHLENNILDQSGVPEYACQLGGPPVATANV